jgi:hypothetical protein
MINSRRLLTVKSQPRIGVGVIPEVPKPQFEWTAINEALAFKNPEEKEEESKKNETLNRNFSQPKLNNFPNKKIDQHFLMF